MTNPHYCTYWKLQSQTPWQRMVGPMLARVSCSGTKTVNEGAQALPQHYNFSARITYALPKQQQR